MSRLQYVRQSYVCSRPTVSCTVQMDEDGFVQVRKKGGQRKHGIAPAAGRTSGQANVQRITPSNGGRGGFPNTSRGYRNADIRQPGRGRQAPSAKPNSAGKPAQQRPAARGPGQESMTSSKPALHRVTDGWGSPKKDGVVSKAPSGWGRKVDGLCFAQVVADRAVSRKVCQF